MKHAARRDRISFPRWGWRVAVSFLAALAAFGATLLIPAPQAEEPPSEAVSEYAPPRTLLLFVHDGGGRLTAAVVLHIDGTVTVTGYPKQTEVVYGTALRPLSACYECEGVETATYLSEYTGGDCDATLRLTVEALASLADRLGNGIVLDGALVTGYRIKELLLDEGTTMTAQATMTARCVAALIDRYLTPKQELAEAFYLLSSLCDDRLIAAQFLAMKDELSRLAAANDGALCRVETVEGRVVGVGEERRFVPQSRA